MELTFEPPAAPVDTTASRIVALIDATMEAENAKQERRTYLGASRLGVECQRALAYEFFGTPKDAGFPAKLLRIFDMGHDGEARVATYLQKAGFTVKTLDKSGKQFGFSTANDKIAGHMDGTIVAGPEVGLKFPAVWENKALGSKSWKDCVAHGVQKSKPIYYAQAQVYMAYFDMDQALFTALNRDSGELYAEVVPFDQRAAQEASDKGVRVVTARSPDEFPRITRDPSFCKCKFCDYYKTCWKGVV